LEIKMTLKFLNSIISWTNFSFQLLIYLIFIFLYFYIHYF
jgi:hypothetical protein